MMKIITEIFIKKKIILVLLVTFCTSQLMMTGCTQSNDKDIANDVSADSESGQVEYDYQIYCLNEDGTGLATWGYDISTENMALENVVDEIYSVFMEMPNGDGYISAKPDEIKNITCTVEENIAKINCDKYYDKLDSLSQLFFKAALVMTLTQIEGIDYVYMTVQGQPLTNSEGEAVGYLSSNSFILNDELMPEIGNELYTTLYLINATGDALVAEEDYYSYDGKQSPPMFVLELLRKRVGKSGNTTIDEKAVVDNAYIKDGICYVDFDDSINEVNYTGIEPEVILYSIVNSLSELEDVTGVQITINGSADELFMDEIDLNRIFRMKLELIEKK